MLLCILLKSLIKPLTSDDPVGFKFGVSIPLPKLLVIIPSLFNGCICFFINKYEIKDKIILTAIVHRKKPPTVLVSTLFFGTK